MGTDASFVVVESGNHPLWGTHHVKCPVRPRETSRVLTRDGDAEHRVWCPKLPGMSWWSHVSGTTMFYSGFPKEFSWGRGWARG